MSYNDKRGGQAHIDKRHALYCTDKMHFCTSVPIWSRCTPLHPSWLLETRRRSPAAIFNNSLHEALTVWKFQKTLNNRSHAHTVVWECCKDDRQSQWGIAKFDPQPTLNPWTDSSPNLKRDYVADISNTKNWAQCDQGCFPPYTRNIHPKSWVYILRLLLRERLLHFLPRDAL